MRQDCAVWERESRVAGRPCSKHVVASSADLFGLFSFRKFHERTNLLQVKIPTAPCNDSRRDVGTTLCITRGVHFFVTQWGNRSTVAYSSVAKRELSMGLLLMATGVCLRGCLCGVITCPFFFFSFFFFFRIDR